MCGIVAIRSENGELSEAGLKQAVRTMVHRGPDSQDVWIGSDGKTGLGHARLSIIDLAGGTQPIHNEDRSLHIVANGEFYGHDAIIEELEKRGHEFRTRSDSEIALHLYEDHGTDCLTRLRGEFAFAIWDEPNRTLFAARDRFGIKPLYYTLQNGTLLVASEIKALLEAGVPAQWNEDYLYNFGDVCVLLHSQTLFRRIYQVPPGHYLVFRNGHLQLVHYWDFDYPFAEGLPRVYSDEEYIEGFSERFEEAVRLRLRADVPVGCYLSGGLDSCAVLGLASEISSNPIRSFTLEFDREHYDESPYAREMAELAGAVYTPIPIKQADIAANFSDALWHSETLFLNGHGISKFLLSRAVNAFGYKVVFTGEGSDEILAGYPHFRRDMALYNTAGQDPAAIQQVLEQLNSSNTVSRGLLLPDGAFRSTDTVRAILGYVPTWIEANASMANKLSSLMHPEFKARYSGHDGYRWYFNHLNVNRQLRGRDAVNQSLYLWSKSILSDYILNVLGDRMEMAHSIEGRVPFLDHHLVEFMRGVPVSLKIRGMTEKYLLREATKPFITKTIYDRQKHPFLSPPSLLHPEEPLFELLQDTAHGKAMKELPFFDQGRIIQMLAEIPSMKPGDRIALDPAFMMMTSACILHERFGMSTA